MADRLSRRASSWKCRSSTQKICPNGQKKFAQFLLLTRQSHVDVATKCSLLQRSCKKEFLQKHVKQILKTCSTWANVLQ